MRNSVLALVLAATAGFALASCGSSSNNNGDMGKDMAGLGGGDMTAVKVNCLGFANCVYNCLINQQGDINSCPTMCSKMAKPGSAAKWNAAVICGQSYCEGNVDAGTDKCDLVPVPGMPGASLLCDPGITYAQCSATTYMSTTCSPCLEEARNFWIFDITVDPMNPGPPTGMCPMPTSTDCTAAKAMCMTQFNACLNDM